MRQAGKIAPLIPEFIAFVKLGRFAGFFFKFYRIRLRALIKFWFTGYGKYIINVHKYRRKIIVSFD